MASQKGETEVSDRTDHGSIDKRSGLLFLSRDVWTAEMFSPAFLSERSSPDLDDHEVVSAAPLRSDDRRTNRESD